MEPVFGLGWWTTLWVKCHSEQCEASKNGLMTLWHFTGLAVMSLNLSHRKTSALDFHAHLSSNSYGTRLEKTNKETPTPTPPSHRRLIYSLQNSSVVHLGESLMTRSVSALTEHDYYCAGMLTYQPTVCGVWAKFRKENLISSAKSALRQRKDRHNWGHDLRKTLTTNTQQSRHTHTHTHSEDFKTETFQLLT